MKTFALTLTLACLASAGRLKRQATGDFWWLTNNETTPGPVPVPPADPNDLRAGLLDPIVGGKDAGNTDTGFINYDPNCECVLYFQCNDGDVNTDGSGLFDIRIKPFETNTRTGLAEGTSPGQCESYLDVCCSVPNKPEVPVTPVTPKPTNVGCGVRNSNGVHVRITGQYEPENAQFGEFPWMSAILRKEVIGEKSVNLYICGGSLIAPNVILTAAHCVAEYYSHPHSLLARLGEWNTQDTNEYYKHQDIGVSKVVVHEKFHPGSLHNDVALLILKESAVLTEHVNTICLPSGNEFFEGQKCISTGWGKNKFGAEGQFQTILKRVDLPVVDNYSCQNSLRTTRLGKYFLLDPSFICAGGVAGEDTCKGDGGSPLVCETVPGSNVYVQTGIVAWGIGCGENSIPGVYANVKQALPWINDILAANGIGLNNGSPY